MAKKYKGFKGSGMNESRCQMSKAAQRKLSAVIARAMAVLSADKTLPSAAQKDMEEK